MKKEVNKIPVFFHEAQKEFHPKYEWALGNRIKHPETTRRAEFIHKELKKHTELFDIIEPARIPLTALRETHGYPLITLYNTASGLAPEETFYPSVFPKSKTVKPDPTNIRHAGFFCFDSGTPLDRNTWTAAAWSAASAYEAAKLVAKGDSKISYSLSRPPGHHANRDTYGGYCYFNNAAIAAKVLRKKGRVVVLDIDFHHGNGTQDIFYSDDRCFVISTHGDPRKYFPFFIGFPSECGSGKGYGYNLNVIIPEKCSYSQYAKMMSQTVLPAISKFEPDFLVVSAGFDTYAKDPVGGSDFHIEDYKKLGAMIANLKLPTVVVQEGGYYAPDLGKNVVSFMSAFKPKG